MVKGFGRGVRRHVVEGNPGNGSYDDRSATEWSKLEESYSGDAHVSWDDLSKEPGFEERQSKVPEESSGGRVEAFVDPYKPETGPEGFDFARRQRKIIAAFESEMGAGAMNAHDVAKDPYQEGSFLQGVIDGRIDDAAEENFLEAIPSGMKGRSGIETLSMIAKDPGAQRAFQVLTDGHADKDGLRGLLYPSPDKKNYRTILGFSEFKSNYLQEFNGNRQEYEKAENSLDNLSNILYGDEQIKYYKAFESLKQRAYYNKYRENPAFAPDVRSMSLNIPEQSQNVAKSETVDREEEVLRGISKQEAERFLANAVIDGDPWKQNGAEYNLTAESLRQLDLGPKFEVEMNGMQICLSEAYRLDKSRAVVGYVPTEEGVKVRSYYFDDKDGAWKYLPDYYLDFDEKHGYKQSVELGKGYDEESIILPAKLQKSLYEISNRSVKSIDRQVNPWFVFAGTAKRYDSKFEYSNAFFSGRMRGDYYQEVDKESAFSDLGGSDYSPEKMMVEPESKPDFSREILNYEGRDVVLGKFQAESFRSRDNELTWTFYNKDEKACIGHVDVGNVTTSTGLNKEWASLGSLGKQLYEEYDPVIIGIDAYKDYRATVDFDDQIRLVDGRYVGMWKNYLRKIPLIREYVQWRDARKK